MPLNGLLALAALARLKQSFWWTAGAVVNAVLYGLPGSAVLLLAAPVAAIAIFAGFLGGQNLEEAELLGAVAAMALPLQRLWRQATGADPARNPLFAQLLLVLDRVVALLPHLLALVAVGVTRIAPLLRPMRDAISSTYRAATEILTMIRLVAENTWEALSLLWSGPNYLGSVVAAVTRTTSRLLTRVGVLVRRTLREVTATLRRNQDSTLVGMVRWLVNAARFVRRVIGDHPVVRTMLGLLDAIDVVGRWWTRRGAATASHPPPAPARRRRRRRRG